MVERAGQRTGRGGGGGGSILVFLLTFVPRLALPPDYHNKSLIISPGNPQEKFNLLYPGNAKIFSSNLLAGVLGGKTVEITYTIIHWGKNMISSKVVISKKHKIIRKCKVVMLWLLATLFFLFPAHEEANSSSGFFPFLPQLVERFEACIFVRLSFHSRLSWERKCDDRTCLKMFGHSQLFHFFLHFS